MSNIEFLSSALAEQCHRVDALQDAVEECLPAYQLGEEVGDEANHIERIEYAGEEIRDLQRDLATARDHLRVSEEQVEALGHMNETNVRLEKERNDANTRSYLEAAQAEHLRKERDEAQATAEDFNVQRVEAIRAAERKSRIIDETRRALDAALVADIAPPANRVDALAAERDAAIKERDEALKRNDTYAAACSAITNAVHRAGIYGEVALAEAVDQIAASRDELTETLAGEYRCNAVMEELLTADLAHGAKVCAELVKERDHALSLSLERYQEIEEIRATMGEANQQMGRATAARDHYRSIAEVGVYAAGSACPCKHTAPCSDSCTCVDPLSSSGCLRCCSYGSPEQRKAQAERLAACEEARALTGDLRGYTMTADEIRALAEQCLLWEPKDWTDPACLRCAERAFVLARALLDRLPVVEAAVEWADSDGCDDLNDPAATALGAAVNALRAGSES